jgi:hypothetical protein
MLYYSGFLNALTNASLLNLQEFEKFENDTTLDNIGDLGDLATKVTTNTALFRQPFL